MGLRFWETGIGMLWLWGVLTCAVEAVRVPLCSTESVTDSIFRFQESFCPINPTNSHEIVGVIEVDEVSLQRALNALHKNSHEYVAVLFYASWCPFSQTLRPSFSVLSSFYSSIPHFAIEESAIRPSILSKYGVHGFPTLILLNSSMRVRYHGFRTLNSLVTFYSDVTGINTTSLDEISMDKVGQPSNQEKHNNTVEESCPFSWAISLDNLLQQETYLALATAFVLLRFLYLFFPTLLAFAQFTWRRHIQNLKLGSLLEHHRTYMNRAIRLLKSLNEPCKKSNLQ